MNSKRFAPLYVLLLLCAREAAAQPACVVNYPLLYPCVFPTADIIFAGRVVALTDMNPDQQGRSRQVEVSYISGSLQGKAVVVVDTLFKGKLAGEVELAFHSRCWGTIKTSKQYVFNVRQTNEGLYADHWSEELDSLPKDDVTYYFEMMRSYVKGEPQPRLFGRLRHQIYGQLVGAPVPHVTVLAEKDGETFETRTDADGRYEFRELPAGNYRVYPLLPESLRPPDDSNWLPRERHNDRATVMSQFLCGARVDFLAWDNGVIAGRVEDADGKPVKYLNPHIIETLRRQGRDKDVDGKPLKWFRVGLLWLIDKNVRQSFPYPAHEVLGLKDGEFAFVNLPPGSYRLEFYGGDMENTSQGEGSKIIFLKYPSDVPGQKEPQVINLAAGQKIRDIIIRLPIPNKK